MEGKNSGNRKVIGHHTQLTALRTLQHSCSRFPQITNLDLNLSNKSHFVRNTFRFSYQVFPKLKISKIVEQTRTKIEVLVLQNKEFYNCELVFLCSSLTLYDKILSGHYDNLSFFNAQFLHSYLVIF